MARRTKAEAESTRAAILDAAEVLFYQHGVSRTTLEKIAKVVLLLLDKRQATSTAKN